jgi:hypothetical protein
MDGIMRFFRIGLIALLAGTAAGLLTSNVQGQPATTIVVPLVPGWNNVAYMGPSAAVADVLRPVDGRYQTVWEFDSQRQAFRAYDPRVPLVSDLKQLTTQRAFWILMQQPATLTYQAQPTSGMLTLYPGLNNIVYIGQEAPLAEVLAPVMGRVQGVWRWDSVTQRWQGAVPGAPLASEFTTMAPGRAYSVQIASGNVVSLHGPEVPRPPVAARQECHSFQARQPELADLRSAFNKAGFGALVTDGLHPADAAEGDQLGGNKLAARRL